MSAKIQKKYSVNATGDLDINKENGIMTIVNTETGEAFNMADLLEDFDGREVKISCNYAEDVG